MTTEQFIKSVESAEAPLRRFLRTLCRGDAAKADDIAQEALIKAYLHHSDFGFRAKFSTWLYRIAYRAFLDWRASAARNATCESIDTPSARKIAAEDAGADYTPLYDAIDALGEKERICVILFYMEDRTIAEIALITAKPAGTVKSLLSRARVHLKKKLQTTKEWN